MVNIIMFLVIVFSQLFLFFKNFKLNLYFFKGVKFSILVFIFLKKFAFKGFFFWLEPWLALPLVVLPYSTFLKK